MSYDRRGTQGRRPWRGRGRSGQISRDVGFGRGRDSNPKRPVKIGFNALLKLQDKDPNDIVLDLTSSRCYQATEELINNTVRMSDDMVILLVSVLAKACDCDTKAYLIQLLNLVPSSRFLTCHLTSYVNRLERMTQADLCSQLRNIIKLFTELLRTYPNCYDTVPLANLKYATGALSAEGQLNDEDILNEVERLIKLKEEKVAELERKEREKVERRNRPRRFQAAVNDTIAPPDDFREISIIPSRDDIYIQEQPFLRRNIVHGRYTDPQHYLDVQFRLLREDFIRPLRDGIKGLLEQQGFDKTKQLQDIRVYKDVRIRFPMCTGNGLVYQIQFNNLRFRGIRWENSKRLIYGSLLCLSKDNFESFVLATVENREVKKLKEGLVEIKFVNLNDQIELDGGDVYQMVETTAYFEAYRHVLLGLKETEERTLPFQRYIVECNNEVRPPAYLRNRMRGTVTFDLTPIMRRERDNSVTSIIRRLRGLQISSGDQVRLLDTYSWPSAEQLGLDNSQLEAVKMALTKEFAVIQGPPGTGKTYIGLKIVKVLLHNKNEWDHGSDLVDLEDHEDGGIQGLQQAGSHRPILVVCYTNHALDQFLEGIHEFHPTGIIRIGGRSNSEIMNECNLRTLKKKKKENKTTSREVRRAFYEIHRELDKINEEMQRVTECLKQCLENIVHENELKESRIMTEEQFSSLRRIFDFSISTRASALLTWLQLINTGMDPDLQNMVFEGEQEVLEEENMDEEEQLEDNEDVTFEGDAMQDMRILDVDDEIIRPSARPTRRGKLQLADPFAALKGKFDGMQAGGWHVQGNPKKLARQLQQKITRELSRKDMMSEAEARAVRNVWAISPNNRWRLYRRWAYCLSKTFKETIATHQKAFNRGAERLSDVRKMEDLEILKTADVIGMTTTGAAKFRNVLQRIQPRITVVEEAAEVLESHIVTSLTPACQHLILIGDHQQLRPNPTVYQLAKDYSLDVSLFERMISNGMPFRRLTAQHRMRPEIAELMKHIYNNLQNHESVKNFPNIKGVSSNIFFIDHQEYEDYVEEGKSRTNLHEATYIAALCRYLILQGYERSQITVLTMYSGQLLQLKRVMPKEFFKGVRISAVDNFQGEENDIVILSLVRSNDDGKIGFLKIENRICVALSRAKKGFYCIGNLSLMTNESDLWRKIVEDMREQGKVGTALILCCQNHPDKQIQASCDKDFSKAPNGGCLQLCDKRLECGHMCEMACHPTDPEHLLYQCKKPCQKKLCENEHKCKRLCFQDCGPCMQPVVKRIPSCGHMQMVPCSVSPYEFSCKEKCQKRLPQCGHICQELCGDKCTVLCKEKIQKEWPCGHINKVECHVDPEDTPCSAPCGALLKCEHNCKGTCSDCREGRLHVHCKSKCGRTLFCGHSCKVSCTKQCPPCLQPCANYCVHSKCTAKCGEPCKPCTEPCKWKCRHYQCSNLCGELCDRPRCDRPCDKLLKCHHPCIGLCGEKCPDKCRECNRDEVTEIFFGGEEDEGARFVELSDCGHIFEVNGLDHWMDMAQENVDGKAIDIHLKECPRCKTPIRTSLRYGNIIKAILADFEEVKKKYYLSAEVVAEKVPALLLEVATIDDSFEEETNYLRKFLNQKSLTAEQLNMVENETNFLKLLKEIKLKIETELDPEIHQHPEKQMEIQMVSTELKNQLNSEVKAVMKKRARFSEQELEEIHGELMRFLLLVSYKVVQTLFDVKGVALMNTDYEKMESIRKALQLGKSIDAKKRERYMARLKRFIHRYAPRVLYKDVTRDEKDMVVKAMGLNQGQWFKCPKGHVYCITECGGAMEEANCPECGSRIGGSNHALRRDNTLATDMDGARHARWSEFTNNFLNFDLRDLN